MSHPSRRQFVQASASLPLAAWASGSGAWQLAEEVAGADGPERPDRIRDFERMAFGLFLHWGLYSQVGAGEWVMNRRGIARDEYFKLMSTFNA